MNENLNFLISLERKKNFLPTNLFLIQPVQIFFIQMVLFTVREFMSFLLK